LPGWELPPPLATSGSSSTTILTPPIPRPAGLRPSQTAHLTSTSQALSALRVTTSWDAPTTTLPLIWSDLIYADALSNDGEDFILCAGSTTGSTLVCPARLIRVGADGWFNSLQPGGQIFFQGLWRGRCNVLVKLLDRLLQPFPHFTLVLPYLVSRRPLTLTCAHQRPCLCL
jgi:hypothetical protein